MNNNRRQLKIFPSMNSKKFSPMLFIFRNSKVGNSETEAVAGAIIELQNLKVLGLNFW